MPHSASLLESPHFRLGEGFFFFLFGVYSASVQKVSVSLELCAQTPWAGFVAVVKSGCHRRGQMAAAVAGGCPPVTSGRGAAVFSGLTLGKTTPRAASSGASVQCELSRRVGDRRQKGLASVGVGVSAGGCALPWPSAGPGGLSHHKRPKTPAVALPQVSGRSLSGSKSVSGTVWQAPCCRGPWRSGALCSEHFVKKAEESGSDPARRGQETWCR